MESKKQYADRDRQAQGGYYVTHVGAMTAEGLHSKSSIAAELAHRDIEIARLHAENTALQSGYDAARLEIASLQAEVAKYRESMTAGAYVGCVVWAGDAKVVRRLSKTQVSEWRSPVIALQVLTDVCASELARFLAKQPGGTP